MREQEADGPTQTVVAAENTNPLIPGFLVKSLPTLLVMDDGNLFTRVGHLLTNFEVKTECTAACAECISHSDDK